MKKLFYLVLVAFVFTITGCGGGGSSSSDSSGGGESNSSVENNETITPVDPVDEDNTTIVLALNVKTVVEPGSIYEARSDDAMIDVEHDLKNDIRYITLVQGEGVIIK